MSQYFSTVSSSLFHNENKSQKTRRKNQEIWLILYGSEICVTITKTHVQNDQMNRSPPLHDHSTHKTVWITQMVMPRWRQTTCLGYARKKKHFTLTLSHFAAAFESASSSTYKIVHQTLTLQSVSDDTSSLRLLNP